MAKRDLDWLWQAKRDLELARLSNDGGFHEWACFACQQAAEKALKALFQHRGADAWGHLLADLVEALPGEVQVPPAVIEAAKELDKHYIPPRYPDALPSGAPGQSYTRGEAERAIANAQRILRFCEDHISG
jgi:HEPN domain-containing protein